LPNENIFFSKEADMVSIWAHHFRRQRCLFLFLGTPLVLVVSAKVAADEYDRAPINYSTALADNPISRLQKRLDAGQAHLKYQGGQGYLRSLPAAIKDYVWRRLWYVLRGRDTSREFEHLSAADRQAILEILLATKKDLPDYWRTSP
jgi:hypothetical protein